MKLGLNIFFSNLLLNYSCSISLQILNVSSKNLLHTSGTLQIQLTVSEDGIVTVVEPGGGKLVDKEELHDAIKMPTDHTLTVHQLQQIVGQQVNV